MYLPVGILLFCSLLVPVFGAGSDSHSPSEELFSKALNQQDMWAKDVGAMKVRAEVTLQPEQGPPITGAYQLDWISPSQWRKELRFANYSRGRIGVPGGYLQKSDTDYTPFFVFEFDHLLRLSNILGI